MRAPVADEQHFARARKPVIDHAEGQGWRLLFPPIPILRKPCFERVADVLEETAEPAAPIERAVSGDQAADIFFRGRLGFFDSGRERLAERGRSGFGRRCGLGRRAA
jgi:hypothetical protein